jgi:hypothetical protein
MPNTHKTIRAWLVGVRHKTHTQVFSGIRTTRHARGGRAGHPVAGLGGIGIAPN